MRRKARQFREGGTGEGAKERENEMEGKKRAVRKREHNRRSRNGFVYPAGGETVSHFLCFGGSGLISPCVTSVSLAAVAKCDTEVF